MRGLPCPVYVTEYRSLVFRTRDKTGEGSVVLVGIPDTTAVLYEWALHYSPLTACGFITVRHRASLIEDDTVYLLPFSLPLCIMSSREPNHDADSTTGLNWRPAEALLPPGRFAIVRSRSKVADCQIKGTLVSDGHENTGKRGGGGSKRRWKGWISATPATVLL